MLLNPDGAFNIDGESGEVSFVGHSSTKLSATGREPLSQIAHLVTNLMVV